MLQKTKEYLRSFFKFQNDLFWNKDIDDLDKRIDLWLDSNENKIQSLRILVQDQLPYCYEEGDWDGKRSDFVICFDVFDTPYVAKLYTSFIDGSEFTNWYSGDEEYEITNTVASWLPIPD